jgi:transcription initiation factor TFIIB
MPQQLYIKKCPECGGINLFWNKEKGEVICKDCGLVVEDKMIDFTQEWRDFDSEEGDRRRRSGAPMTYTQYDQGLGTEVGIKSDLRNLGKKERNKFFRLRKWQYRISTAIERNLKLALAELKRVASYLKLPKSVEEEAARIYTLAVQRGLVRGRSMESVVAGALYAACRRHEVPRTLDELSEASGIEKKEIGRTYRFVTRELGIKIMPSNPSDYIARFASALKLSPETQSKAVEILDMAQDAELTSGRGPTGIAAASLYVSSLMHGEKRTQREVADVAGVTEVTIRNRYKELLDKLELEKEIKKVKKKKGKKD